MDLQHSPQPVGSWECWSFHAGDSLHENGVYPHYSLHVEAATHQQNQVEGTSLASSFSADRARVGLLLSKQLQMVGRGCHSSFKAPALEAMFAINHICRANAWRLPSPYTWASSDIKFGSRVLMLAGSSAPAPHQGDGHRIPPEQPSAGREAELQS